MTILHANSAATLTAIVAIAKSGDTILLAEGTYSHVSLRNVDFQSNVTIASSNPDHPAVLTSLTVRGSTGLTFKDIEFQVNPKGIENSFEIRDSHNIILDGLSVHGSENGTPADDMSGIMIRSSSQISVINSTFFQLFNGVSILDNSGITISGNEFHDIRTDGIRGGGTSDLTIKGNHFTDFYPALGDHPDAIQLWSTNTTESARDITISDNIFTRGQGGVAQGIFIRDTNDSLPFENVLIENNTIIGGMANGITVDGGRGVRVTGNTVIGDDANKSHIRMENVTDGYIGNNQASGYQYFGVNEIVRDANVLVRNFTVSSLKALGTILAPLVETGVIYDTIARQVQAIGYIDDPMTGGTNAVFAEILIAGTSGDDRLQANAIGDSRIDGYAGNDMLTDSTNDSHRLFGGSGNDTYIINNATTAVFERADEGRDTVNTTVDFVLGDHFEELRLMAANLTGTGNALDNRMVGSSGDDTMNGMAGADAMQGGDGNDRLYGGDGNDTVRGDGGDDWLWGQQGNDLLIGGAGNDWLDGGAGDDVLEGGSGADVMTGGAGRDIFRLRPADIDASWEDVIVDFVRGQDRIDLNAIDARPGGANDAFSFIGTAGFSSRAGELRYEIDSHGAHVMGDMNGDGAADFNILVTDVTILAASDFLL